jgi:hypothetical protein
LDEWKSSACVEGARQAWANLKCHFPNLKLEPLILTYPKDKDGNEARPDSYYDDVLPHAKHTERACSLKNIIQ